MRLEASRMVASLNAPEASSRCFTKFNERLGGRRDNTVRLCEDSLIDRELADKSSELTGVKMVHAFPPLRWMGAHRISLRTRLAPWRTDVVGHHPGASMAIPVAFRGDHARSMLTTRAHSTSAIGEGGHRGGLSQSFQPFFERQGTGSCIGIGHIVERVKDGLPR